MAEAKTRIARDRLRQAYAGNAKATDGAPDTELADLDTVVIEHSEQVRRIARRIARSTGGAIDVDDLFSVGVIGLIQAFHAYSSDAGRPFGVYAEYRIRGAMLDEMRRLDPMSQPMRRKSRALDKAVHKLSHELGREPTETEIAAHLDVTIDALRQTRREVQQHRFVAYEDTRIDDLRLTMSEGGQLGPNAKIALAQGISKLGERLQQLLMLYYYHDLSLKEIGAVLEITEARVCQLHKQAVSELKAILAI